MKETIWLFSFEFAGIKKVGGLGEVPANQARVLQDDYNIVLFMPSHGVHKDPRIVEKLGLKELSLHYDDHINALKFDLGDLDEKICIRFYEGKIGNIGVILLAGANEYSMKMLDDNVVYRPESIEGKILLFAKGMKYYTAKIAARFPEKTPTLIHCHDHHGIPAMIGVRQTLRKFGKDAATVLTIHLLTWPRIPYEFLTECGIENSPIPIYINGEKKVFTPRRLYDICKNEETLEPTLEKIGVIFADMVTSVSKHYLEEEILPKLGNNMLNGKTDFVWNGCDWKYEENYKYTVETLGLSGNGGEIPRYIIRKEVLRKIGDLPTNEPIIESRKIIEFLKERLTKYPYVNNGEGVPRPTGFDSDGPLVIMTGRISKQKGIDIVLDTISFVKRKHPDVKYIISLIPTEYTLDEIDKFMEIAEQYPDNLRIIFGKLKSLFIPLHIAADIYCAPSRWEPFGIMSLEAMASGAPIVGAAVGGIQETVADLRDDPEKGTGLLEKQKNGIAVELGRDISDLISILRISELKARNELTDEAYKDLLGKIEDKTLARMVESDPDYGRRIRKNCLERVDNLFRWEITAKKLHKVYAKAIENRRLTA